MTNTAERGPRHIAPKEANKLVKGMFNTIPIVLAGSMAMSINVTGPLEHLDAKRIDKPKPSPTEPSQARIVFNTTNQDAVVDDSVSSATITTAAVAPTTYRVVAGDTISGIAGRYGLATASVLALNGLGWKSVIFPGQTLKLTNGSITPIASAPTPVSSSGRYTIVAGDTIGKIAAKFGVSTQSVLSANGLGWSSIIYPGQTLAIPTTSPASVVVNPASYVTPIAPSTANPVSKTVTSTYVIKTGDTIGKIATQFGVSIQSILNANGLSWSSIIYTGRSLTIPGAAVLTTASSTTTGLTTEMATNATTIIRVGKSLGVSDYGIVIALATAMQESSLINLSNGDRDSVGLFQQRPSAGWGSVSQLTDPTYASRLFFGGASNPNKGNTRGLLDISGWQSMTVTQAAQAVQKSAYPDAYAKWEASAWVWLDLLT